MEAFKAKTVAIGGLGFVGTKVAKSLIDGIEGLRLVAVSDMSAAIAQEKLDAIGALISIFDSAALADKADIVIECLPAKSFGEIAIPVIEAGKILVPLTAAAMLDHIPLIERAKTTGARILMPSGALLAFDAVRSAAEGEIYSVKIKTRKPPSTLTRAPFVLENGILLENLRELLCVFLGSARLGARGFPANVNVAAALSLAGIGPDRTLLEVWADPTVDRNTHEIEVDADSARFSMKIESIPSLENPRTGKFTPAERHCFAARDACDFASGKLEICSRRVDPHYAEIDDGLKASVVSAV